MANQFFRRSHLATAVLLIAFFASGWAHAGVYKWVDEDGKVHYGDKPPEQADSAHSVLDSRGLTISDVERAKTGEELAEANKIAEAIKLQELEDQLSRHRDNVLLLTFTTERDLLLTRDDRLSAIDSAILLSERRITGWNTKLAELDRRIEGYTSTQQIPEKLQNDRDKLHRRISSSEGYMLDKMDERQRTSRQFEDDLTRYRELKGTN